MMFEATARKAPQNTHSPAEILAAFAADVLGKKDFSNLDQFMRADYVQHNPLVPQGSEGFRQFFEAWFKASPDFRYDVKQMAVSGDRIWVFGTYSGTHAGDWLGIPATDKRYSFDAVDIFRIADGKLAEHWDVLDVYSLLRQLGTIA